MIVSYHMEKLSFSLRLWSLGETFSYKSLFSIPLHSYSNPYHFCLLSTSLFQARFVWIESVQIFWSRNSTILIDIKHSGYRLILTHCSTLIAALFKNKQQWNFPFLPWVVRTSSTWMIPNIDYHQAQIRKAKGLYTRSFYAIMWLQEFVRSLCAWRVRSGLESPEIKCITSVRERHPMSTAKPWRIVHHTFNASVLKSRVLHPTFCQHI